MKTIFDELQQEVKNWWISLILGIQVGKRQL